jgi:PhnB protein
MTEPQTVTAYLCAKGAAQAIDFYARAFGAEELSRYTNEDGTLGHAEIVIGKTTLYLSDEWPEGNVYSPATLGGATTAFVLEVTDADAAFERAIHEGATIERALKDEPYGRAGWILDPFGHRWSIMTPNLISRPETSP